MNDKCFLDTNILIYCYTSTEPDKLAKAQAVASLPNVVISTQVLKELANVLRKKFNLDWPSIQATLNEVENNFEVCANTALLIRHACSIADRYGFSFYDSLIIAASLESGCTILYSEDLQNGQVIENTLTIKNPFL
ncbi:MAG: PIN domain-containing protein [Lewinellaceae bacterium]|nr:PIN domain-containing protein [Phaeodactylibacter sp.]MCB9348831.1 PIN domain-containing protein [Lewinellaceae bacterium]